LRLKIKHFDSREAVILTLLDKNFVSSRSVTSTKIVHIK
jgi:hypothetical protein